MVIDQVVDDILDQTIQALTLLDLKKLQILEQRIVAVAESKVVFNQGNLNSQLAKKRTLELILQSCKSNLDMLNRLHRRNVRDQWAH
jgi:hypothetical protein